MKKCFQQKTDGQPVKIKDCAESKRIKKRAIFLALDAKVEAERKRGREKYKRLGYKDKYKTSPINKRRYISTYVAKFPEKVHAKNACAILRRKLKIEKGMQLHHWSYRAIHCKDVIILKNDDHTTAHRYLVYDQEEKMYRTREGDLLDTKVKHAQYINSCITADAFNE